MNDEDREFHLEEYKLLKGEVAGLMVRIETMARLGALVSAAVFSWLVVQGVGSNDRGCWCLKLPKALIGPAWYIPFSLSIVLGIAAFAAYWRGRQLGEYLHKLESALANQSLGWERTLATKASILTYTGCAYWTVLIVGTLVAGYTGASVIDGIASVCAPAK